MVMPLSNHWMKCGHRTESAKINFFYVFECFFQSLVNIEVTAGINRICTKVTFEKH